MSIKKIILQNRKINYEYNIIYNIEAGVVLEGSEVKSLRNGKASLNDSFIYPKGNEVFIHNLYIAPYENAVKAYSKDSYRVRKLLLNRGEINKISGHVKKTGVTIVPVKVYFNEKNIIKVEIAVVTGKKKYDKRQDIKDREWGRKKQGLLKNTLNEKS